MAESPDLSLSRFWAPRYWGVWIIWLWTHVIACMPLAWQLQIGKRLGHLLIKIKKRERATAERNLQVCFPELTDAERAALLIRHFEAVGASFAEMATGWYWPIEKLQQIITVEGREHLDAARAKGKGIILLGAHFTTLEIGVSILEVLAPGCTSMYRPQRNRMMDVLIRRGRSRFSDNQIPRDNVRALLRSLKDNRTLVYTPDQTYLGNQSALLPFFGEPALTNVATSKLAKISGATMLPYFFRRLDDDSGYVVNIGAPLPGFPSDDPAADTQKWVTLLEDYIRLAPEQYLWLYKKFKRRPASFPDLYRN